MVLAGEINFGALSLEEFVHAGAQPGGDGETAVSVFGEENSKLEDLHNSIVACDEVLKSVEIYLTSFQSDLAAVSSEIEHLQNRSNTLNNKLQNRRTVEQYLRPEVEALAISPVLIRKITEGTVDEGWVKALDELEKKSNAVDDRAKAGQDVKAAQDLKPFLDDVSTKAVERIRDYVVAQIKALRSPNVNAQVVQQNSFLRYRGVFAFLATREPQLAEDMSKAYTNTMRWYYASHFTRYRAALEKMSIYSVDQTDTIGTDPATKRAAKPGASHDAFALGRRADVLRGSEDIALLSYIAEEDRSMHYLEAPFRAFNLALVDNLSAEFSFLTDFFPRQTFHATIGKFNEIFGSTFELGRALTKQLIETSFDALGVLICVRLTQHLAFELQRRKVPAGEGYLNATNMLLWPRFQQIIDAHCESVRKSTAALPGKPAGSALSLTGSSASAPSTAPHALTQRFANFVQGILALNSEAGDDEPVSHSLGRLRADFEAFLVKLSKGIAEARKRERFLYNNYSLICTIIAETEGKLAEELKRHFMELRDAVDADG